MTEQIIPKDFYVYAHAKATTGEIFYIGKGGPRHRREKSIQSRNPWWHRTVKKHGLKVIFVRDGLQEWAAFELEQEMIALHGRKDLGLGPLVNLTDGGEGASGQIGASHSEEFKAAASARAKAMWAKDEHRAAHAERLQQMNSRPEVKAAKSLRAKAMHQDPAFKAANVERMRIRNAEPCVAKANTERLKALWSSEAFRVAQAEATRAAKSKGVINLTTGHTFESVTSAVADLRIGVAPKASTGRISAACSGKRKSAYGYTWAYA